MKKNKLSAFKEPTNREIREKEKLAYKDLRKKELYPTQTLKSTQEVGYGTLQQIDRHIQCMSG